LGNLQRETGKTITKRIRSFIPLLVVALLSAIAWWVPYWSPGWYAGASRWRDEHLLFVVVLSVGLVLLFFWFLFRLLFRKLPQREVTYVFNAKDRLDLELKSRQTSIQMVGLAGGLVGGVALLGGLYFTAQTLRISQGTLQTAQEGQITERFTKAIEQLGRDNLSIRLGGIYALERIARDSAKDHWPVMQVLTAYVRERAPVQEQPLDTTVKDGKKQDAPRTQGCEIKEDMLTLFGLHGKLPADVQAILDVLSQRAGHYGYKELYPLDLRNTHLPKARLDNAQLQHAILIGANLQDAYLSGAHLQHATLIEARLQRADLTWAELSLANLIEANLQDACLNRAELQDAILLQTHLERADLREANLKGARLWKAQLQGANLTGAKNLTQDQIDRACVDGDTKLPEGFSRTVPCPASQP
jgi:Pentapeptide repeats (8 copies)